MAPTVERITDIPLLKLGEGPHWDVETQNLYFLDIFGKSINKYVPSTGQYTSAKLGKETHVVIPVKGKKNQFVAAIEGDICIITWDGITENVTKTEKIAELEQGKNTLNDGKCDPKGRLWVGSYGPQLKEKGLGWSKNGSLFSLDNGQVSTHLTEVHLSNGIAWNKELKEFYFIDTFKGTVDAFDFDVEQGKISNRREIFTVNKHGVEGKPDGMTIDVDGNLWVAVFGGSCVLRIDPRKPETLLQKVEIPAKSVTSAAWGGADLDTLYVTTANFDPSFEELPPPNNGGTFKVTGLGTRGLPMENFVL